MGPVLISEKEILSKEVSDLDERVSCFNKYNCLTKNTKLVIVGTITPPKGTNNGYFYSAPRNQIYGLIDMAKGTNLLDLKNSLKVTENKSEVIEEIKTILKENNIAFLDIMKYAIREKEQYEDKKIKYYCLDIESFKNIPDSVYFICNSVLALEGYLKICEELKRKPNYKYLTQYWGKIDKEEWVKTIKQYTNANKR